MSQTGLIFLGSWIGITALTSLVILFYFKIQRPIVLGLLRTLVATVTTVIWFLVAAFGFLWASIPLGGPHSLSLRNEKILGILVAFTFTAGLYFIRRAEWQVLLPSRGQTQILASAFVVDVALLLSFVFVVLT